MGKTATALFGGPVIGSIIWIVIFFQAGTAPFARDFGEEHIKLYSWVTVMIITAVILFLVVPKANKTNAVEVKMTATDELVKYSTMLKDGHITQEEFDKKKQELL